MYMYILYTYIIMAKLYIHLYYTGQAHSTNFGENNAPSLESTLLPHQLHTLCEQCCMQQALGGGDTMPKNDPSVLDQINLEIARLVSIFLLCNYPKCYDPCRWTYTDYLMEVS